MRNANKEWKRRFGGIMIRRENWGVLDVVENLGESWIKRRWMDVTQAPQ
jgi:hypothetical protein